MKKVILIDGNNLLFRSYFATLYSGANMKTSKGQATNALYGFTTMINKIIAEENPTYMVVAFDVGKNFRHEKYREYKAGRNDTPEDLKSQFKLVSKLLDALGIAHLECIGYEADDIIGTLASEVDKNVDFKGLIISSDHDLLQLISKEVSMKMLKPKGYTYYDLDTFTEEYNFIPKRIIDMKALMGDPSDNIPGVKGIGEKTAKSLIQTYETLDNIYESIENIKGKLKEKLAGGKEMAYFSYELATIFREVPIDTNLEKYTYRGPNIEELRNVYREFEFYSLLKSLSDGQSGTYNQERKINYIEINNVDDIKPAIEFSYYIEANRENYHFSSITALSLYDGSNAYFIPQKLIVDVLKKIKNNLRYTYNLKKNIVLCKNEGIDLDNTDYDSMIAYHLLNGTTKDDLAIIMQNFGESCYLYEDYIKSKTTEQEFKSGIVNKAKFIWDNKEKVLENLKIEKMHNLFSDIEIPLSFVLAEMEIEGIRVDRLILNNMEKELANKIDLVKEEIYKEVGMEFNIASPKQLADILFNKLCIPYPGKKTTTPSTDVSVLLKLKNNYKIIPLILNFRTLTKLYNTYVYPLKNYIKNDGKIHTIYKQTLTRTGRLSSVEPNLQNIPSHEEEGRIIKKAFLPEDDSVLLSADYSQIELRILAHISGDETMIKAFKNGDDIHRKVAADIYGVDINDVTKEMRSNAKSVIFGIVYGISGFGLSENTNMKPSEAKLFIEKYYELYPKVKKYMDKVKVDAYNNGFVQTLYSRKRNIEELKSPVYTIRSGGERIALNTPIQGTGADIIKIAMNGIFRELKKRKLESKLLLQVHDEVIINVKKSEYEIVKEIVKTEMENVTCWDVPLKCEINVGNTWYEAK